MSNAEATVQLTHFSFQARTGTKSLYPRSLFETSLEANWRALCSNYKLPLRRRAIQTQKGQEARNNHYDGNKKKRTVKRWQTAKHTCAQKKVYQCNTISGTKQLPVTFISVFCLQWDFNYIFVSRELKYHKHTNMSVRNITEGLIIMNLAKK